MFWKNVCGTSLCHLTTTCCKNLSEGKILPQQPDKLASLNKSPAVREKLTITMIDHHHDWLIIAQEREGWTKEMKGGNRREIIKNKTIEIILIFMQQSQKFFSNNSFLFFFTFRCFKSCRGCDLQILVYNKFIVNQEKGWGPSIQWMAPNWRFSGGRN